jgi:hypothetical protein
MKTMLVCLLGCLFLFGGMGQASAKQVPKDITLKCQMTYGGQWKGFVSFQFAKAKRPKLVFLGKDKKGWGVQQSTIGTYRFRTSSNSHVLYVGVPSSKKTGMNYRLYFKGQQSQLPGKKHAGKLLLFSMRYPIPPDARLAPNRWVCERVTFVKQ